MIGRTATLKLEEYDPAAVVLRRVQDDEGQRELEVAFVLEVDPPTAGELRKLGWLQNSRRGEMPREGSVH